MEEEIYTSQDLISVGKTKNHLQSQYDKIIVRMKTIETNLSILNSKVRSRGIMPESEYKTVCRRQSQIKQELIDLQPQRSYLKGEIREKEVLRDEILQYLNRNKPQDIKLKLQKIRDKYMEFSSDTTRVSSTRVMASRFSEELQELINTL